MLIGGGLAVAFNKFVIITDMGFGIGLWGVWILQLLVGLILLVFMNGALSAQVDCKHDEYNFKCVKLVSVYDGDTITVNIPNVPPLFGKKIGIRLYGIDTPEIRGKSECEKKRAKEARDFVSKLLSNAEVINLKNVSRGKYFRVVAAIEYDGKDLATALFEKQFGYPYLGDTKPEVDWCDPNGFMKMMKK